MNDLIKETSISSYANINGFIKENEKNLNYYHLHEVCEMLLRTPEAEKKTLLGGYTSKLLKNWLGLRQLYRKDSIHLADIAKAIDKNLTFEMFYLILRSQGIKKELSLFDSQIRDKVDQIQINNSSLKVTETELKSYCQMNEIDSEDVNCSLKNSLLKTPEILQKIVEKIKSKKIIDAISFYRKFTSFVSGVKLTDCVQLKVLEYIFHNDNDLVEIFNKDNSNVGTLIAKNKKRYELLKNHIENLFKSKLNIINEIELTNNLQWDINLEESSKNENLAEDKNIDWTTKITKDEEFEIIDQEESEDFDYSETILMNKLLRETLVCEIDEIIQFLTQRISESQNHSIQSIFQTYQSKESEGLFDITMDNLVAFRKYFENLLESISCFKFRNFISLIDNPKKIQTIVDHVENFKLKIQKKVKNAITLKEKISELENQKSISSQELTALCHETACYRPFIEKELTSLMGREIKLVGSITKLTS